MGRLFSGFDMQIGDTRNSFGIVTRVVHWAMAIAIFALFALGYWMVELTYYDPWYTTAPYIHKAVGIVVMGALVARFAWRIVNEKPSDADLKPIEQTVSRVVHWGFYPLLAALMVSGYLISTPDGRPIDVFGVFQMPAIVIAKGIEDEAGRVHEILAWATIVLAVLHAGAALKHHFVDRHDTLIRIWSGRHH